MQYQARQKYFIRDTAGVNNLTCFGFDRLEAYLTEYLSMFAAQLINCSSYKPGNTLYRTFNHVLMTS